MVVKLTEKHYKKLGQLLLQALPTKDNPSDYDTSRAAVLIFSLIQKGYDFGEEELEGVMQESGGGFSEKAEKWLFEIRGICNLLYKGLNDTRMERFKLKDF